MTQGITYIIKDDAGVQALLGQNKAETKYKVYPGLCDQPEQWPYTVVRVMSKIPFKCRGTNPTKFTYTFQVITYHLDYLKAQELDKMIFWALDNKSGTHNGVVFNQPIQFEDSKDETVQTPGNILHAKVSVYIAIVNEDQAT
jgi:hypothetical protein